MTGWKVNVEQWYYATSRSRSVSPAVKMQNAIESHDVFASPEPVPAGTYDQAYSKECNQRRAVRPSAEPVSPLVPPNTPELDSSPTLYQNTDRQGDIVKQFPHPATYGEAYQTQKRVIQPKPRPTSSKHEASTKQATRLDCPW